MYDKEFEKYLNDFIAWGKKVTATKESSRRFLIELGVINEDGSRGEHYQNLCIPVRED